MRFIRFPFGFLCTLKVASHLHYRHPAIGVLDCVLSSLWLHRSPELAAAVGLNQLPASGRAGLCAPGGGGSSVASRAFIQAVRTVHGSVQAPRMAKERHMFSADLM